MIKTIVLPLILVFFFAPVMTKKLSAKTGDAKVAASKTATTKAAAKNVAVMEKNQLSDLSLYHLNKPWRDHNSNEFQLTQLVGQDVVIGMVYTKCPHACPMIVAKMMEFKKKANQKGLNKMKFVLASFDVERDTPHQLKSYMKRQNLDEDLWTFLSPPNEATARELAVALGISYKRLDDGEFSHSNTITLLNKEGVPIAKIENLNESVETLIKPLFK